MYYKFKLPQRLIIPRIYYSFKVQEYITTETLLLEVELVLRIKSLCFVYFNQLDNFENKL